MGKLLSTFSLKCDAGAVRHRTLGSWSPEGLEGFGGLKSLARGDSWINWWLQSDLK